MPFSNERRKKERKRGRKGGDGGDGQSNESEMERGIEREKRCSGKSVMMR